MVFVSQADLLGGDPDHGGEIYVVDADGTGLNQLTSFVGGSTYGPAISGDGSTIVFTHDGDPTGGNADLNREIFAIQADGTNLRQLTSTTSGDNSGASISADGSTVVFESDSGGSIELFRIDPDGSGLSQFTTGGGRRAQVDGTGTWVAFRRDGAAYRVRTDGSGLEQIAAETSRYPDTSESGDLIAYTDGNGDIFVHDATDDSTQQLTFDGDHLYRGISGDGRYVYYATGSYDVERVRVDSGEIERVAGLILWDVVPGIPFSGVMGTDRDGRVVFAAQGNIADRNPDSDRDDGTLDSEIFLVDRTTPAAMRVGPGPAPTVVSWDVVSGPVQYDVIRGDVANLGPPGGETVDLGPVACIDEDSRDSDTASSPDDLTPSPGQVFFYLFRTVDWDGLHGSYGQASDDAERLAGPGDCNS